MNFSKQLKTKVIIMAKYYYAKITTVEYCDLHRFTSKKERDLFASQDDCKALSSKQARDEHKEQFRFWAGK